MEISQILSKILSVVATFGDRSSLPCMKNLRQFTVTFATDCSQLVNMVSESYEWPTFANYLEDKIILILK